jgi:hypothetical protein
VAGNARCGSSRLYRGWLDQPAGKVALLGRNWRRPITGRPARNERRPSPDILQSVSPASEQRACESVTSATRRLERGIGEVRERHADGLVGAVNDGRVLDRGRGAHEKCHERGDDDGARYRTTLLSDVEQASRALPGSVKAGEIIQSVCACAFRWRRKARCLLRRKVLSSHS